MSRASCSNQLHQKKTIAAICKGKGIIASPTSIRRILHEEGLIAHAMSDAAVGTAALLTTSLQLCLDLVHCHLAHVSEECCYEFVCQSVDLNQHEKHAALSSSLSPFCSVCLSGKQTTHGIS